VAIYDYGEAREHDAPAYIVMELVEGESLRQLLRREGRLAPERTVALMRDICAGVGAAHRRQIFHRDLKPDNVIVLAPDADLERELRAAQEEATRRDEVTHQRAAEAQRLREEDERQRQAAQAAQAAEAERQRREAAEAERLRREEAERLKRAAEERARLARAA